MILRYSERVVVFGCFHLQPFADVMIVIRCRQVEFWWYHYSLASKWYMVERSMLNCFKASIQRNKMRHCIENMVPYVIMSSLMANRACIWHDVYAYYLTRRKPDRDTLRDAQCPGYHYIRMYCFKCFSSKFRNLLPCTVYRWMRNLQVWSAM